jgi:hypothetical protein
MKKIILLIPLFLMLLSGCGGFQRIEKTDTFKLDRKAIKTVAFLEPDYFIYSSKRNKLIENKKTLKTTKKIVEYTKEAAQRLEITPIMLDEVSTAQNVNTLLMLKQFIMRSCVDFHLSSYTNWGIYSKKSVISEDLNLPPELNSLAQVYQTPYFYYSFVVKSKGILTVNALADVSQGKIIYMEIKGVSPPSNYGNLWQSIFGSLNVMFASK